MFDKTYCGVRKNAKNIEMFAKHFIKRRYYGSMFTVLFLDSLKHDLKVLQEIYFPCSSGKP